MDWNDYSTYRPPDATPWIVFAIIAFGILYPVIFGN